MKNNKNDLKSHLHPRNLHNLGYDFDILLEKSNYLKPFVYVNEYGTKTVDFSNVDAVFSLNKALLQTYYGITFYELPNKNLIPPIPGRADYIHYIADLLAENNNGEIPIGDGVLGLDVGVGANCIYPILGNKIYDWSFVASDIYLESLENCMEIIKNNSNLSDFISLQLQGNSRFIFQDIILPEDKFSFTVCNPPFHKSLEEAKFQNIRKTSNLQKTKVKEELPNFSGFEAELYCDGGELAFITQMLYESKKYPLQVLWFTTLVSKKAHLESILRTIQKINCAEYRIIEMAQGQKTSRVFAWTFQTKEQQSNWKFS
jgi:23S rRNA (adenine1618-N6)-methyltransferase